MADPTIASPSPEAPIENAASGDHTSPITGVFGGKETYGFEMNGKRQKAGQWRKDLKDRLKTGWGTDRAVQFSEWLFYIL